ncbi:MAG: enoyl-CoA hydratase/isomerase family protein [Micromonosporaceae bacterium]
MTFDAAALDARTDTIRVSERNGAVTVTLSRPERLNALGPDMLAELLEVLAAVRGSRDVKALVLTGKGRAFCAGVDLRTPFFMENVESDSVFEGTRLLDLQHELIAALYELPQPTVAAVNGDAVGGGGFGMAMACDMRFAVSSARFWMIPSQLNVVQDFGLTWLLQRCIGMPRTMELVYSGRRVDGVEAAGLGIVNRAFDRLEDMTAHVDSVVGAITGMGSDAGRMLKLVVRHGATSPLRDQLRVEAIANGLCFTSPEFQSAKSAMLERMKRR